MVGLYITVLAVLFVLLLVTAWRASKHRDRYFNATSGNPEHSEAHNRRFKQSGLLALLILFVFGTVLWRAVPLLQHAHFF